MRSVLRLPPLMACLIVLASARCAAQAQDTLDITITEFGLYTSRLQFKEPSGTAATGYVNRVTDVRLVERTDRICARIGVDFGLDYQVSGTPAGAAIELDMVTRYPVPGIVDPKGRHHATSSFASSTTIGGTGYRSFTFEYAWEMIAGEWVFEFHHRGRKIAEKQFTVALACGIS